MLLNISKDEKKGEMCIFNGFWPISITRCSFIIFLLFPSNVLLGTYRMYRIKPDIGKFSYLGFWVSSLPKIGQFLIAILNKHPSIRLNEKTVQFWGKLAIKSLKIQICFQISRA